MADSQNAPTKPDLFAFIKNLGTFFKVIFYDVGREIYIGFSTNAIPTYLCLTAGILISGSFLIYLDGWVFSLFHKNTLLIPMGRFRDCFGIVSLFFGFYGWGLYRMIQRVLTGNLLSKAFKNAGLETKLKELPQFYADFPIDEFARKLRLRAGGLPLSEFMSSKDYLESGLRISITKMENPGNNKEFIDVIYTTSEMPGIWHLDNMKPYKDFSFPIGLSYRGEIKANLKDIAHFLIAGESGGGKSTFIRMMLTVLLSNNDDLEIYYLDFKGGMENQIFSGFTNFHCVDEFSDAALKMAELKKTLETRMAKFKTAKARSLEMYNRAVLKNELREKRIVVVVDEIAEIMPTFKGKANSDLVEINSALNKIARMGRAVGVNLVVGVQKPDAKNLDPTIKANLSGVLCFAVSHFSQSTIVLGNSRAADLNKEYKGRAIWKHGVEFVEVQTPLLDDDEVKDVRGKIDGYWKQKSHGSIEKKEITVNSKPISQDSEAGSSSS